MNMEERFQDLFDANHDARDMAFQAIRLLQKQVGKRWFEPAWRWLTVSGLNECLRYLDMSNTGELGKMEFSVEAAKALPYEIGPRLNRARSILIEAVNDLNSNTISRDLKGRLSALLAEDVETRKKLEDFDFDDQTAPVDALHACSEHALKAAYIGIMLQFELSRPAPSTEWNETALVSFLLEIGEARRSRQLASNIQVFAPLLMVAASVLKNLSEIMMRSATGD